MSTPTIEAMAERLEQIEARCRLLERRARRLRLTAAAALGAGLIAATAGAQGPKGPTVLEANRLVLRDLNGRVYASFDAGLIGNRGLTIRDAAGRSRLFVGLKRSGIVGLGQPEVSIDDARGRLSAFLGLLPDDEAMLSLSYGGDPLEAVISSSQLRSHLHLSGPAGTSLIDLSTARGQEWSTLWMFDAKKVLRVDLGFQAGPYLQLNDRFRKPIRKLP